MWSCRLLYISSIYILTSLPPSSSFFTWSGPDYPSLVAFLDLRLRLPLSMGIREVPVCQKLPRWWLSTCRSCLCIMHGASSMHIIWTMSSGIYIYIYIRILYIQGKESRPRYQTSEELSFLCMMLEHSDVLKYRTPCSPTDDMGGSCWLIGSVAQRLVPDWIPINIMHASSTCI